MQATQIDKSELHCLKKSLIFIIYSAHMVSSLLNNAYEHVTKTLSRLEDRVNVMFF